MKKESVILIAGAVGLATAVGFFLLKRFLSNKEYHAEYHDYYRHFSKEDIKHDDHHGIEYLSMI